MAAMWLLALFLGVVAIAAWQLWRACKHGRIFDRYRDITERPTYFWIVTSYYAFMLAVGLFSSGLLVGRAAGWISD
jgi:hypothetical protein